MHQQQEIQALMGKKVHVKYTYENLQEIICIYNFRNVTSKNVLTLLLQFITTKRGGGRDHLDPLITATILHIYMGALHH